MDEQAKAIFREATRLRDAGDYPAARALLLGLLERYPGSPALLGTLGGVAFSARDFVEAKAYFSQVVKLSPKSELASLGLFHALWNLDEQDAAKAELSRYLMSHDSEEYETLMSEMGWRLDRATAKVGKVNQEHD